MTTAQAQASLASPPELHFSATGEHFVFRTSARSGDGRFRFRWTLAPGRRGPPEHVHDDETESFDVVSGSLRIWIEDRIHDIGAGESIAVPPGVRHRFLNAGDVPVVVDVSLNGPRMENALVPLAIRFDGRRDLGVGDMLVMLGHLGVANGSRPPSRVVAACLDALSRCVRWFGVGRLPPVEPW